MTKTKLSGCLESAYSITPAPGDYFTVRGVNPSDGVSSTAYIERYIYKLNGELYGSDAIGGLDGVLSLPDVGGALDSQKFSTIGNFLLIDQDPDGVLSAGSVIVFRKANTLAAEADSTFYVFFSIDGSGAAPNVVSPVGDPSAGTCYAFLAYDNGSAYWIEAVPPVYDPSVTEDDVTQQVVVRTARADGTAINVHFSAELTFHVTDSSGIKNALARQWAFLTRYGAGGADRKVVLVVPGDPYLTIVEVPLNGDAASSSQIGTPWGGIKRLYQPGIADLLQMVGPDYAVVGDIPDQYDAARTGVALPIDWPTSAATVVEPADSGTWHWPGQAVYGGDDVVIGHTQYSSLPYNSLLIARPSGYMVSVKDLDPDTDGSGGPITGAQVWGTP